MQEKSVKRSASQRRRVDARRGAIMALLPFVILAILGIGVVMIDLGALMASRSHGQNAADSASMAGALQLRAQYPSAAPVDVSDRANEFMNHNYPASGSIAGSTIEVGEWDAESRSFFPNGPDSNAVRVSLQIDCPCYFSTVFGGTGKTVNVSSISAFRVTEDDEGGEEEVSMPSIVG